MPRYRKEAAIKSGGITSRAAVALLLSSTVLSCSGPEKRRTEEASSPIPEGVILVVTYVHGTLRCPTCLEMERLSKAAVEEAMAPEIAGGVAVWRSLDYDLPENAHYSLRYDMRMPSLVLSRRAGDREVEWKALGRIWDLIVENPDALGAYVREETLAFMARAG